MKGVFGGSKQGRIRILSRVERNPRWRLELKPNRKYEVENMIAKKTTLLSLRKEDQELFTMMEDHLTDTKLVISIRDAWYPSIKFSRDGRNDQRTKQERCISGKTNTEAGGRPAGSSDPCCVCTSSGGRNWTPRAKVLTVWRLYSPILWTPLVRNADLDDIKYCLVRESGETPDVRKPSTLECGPPERCLTGSLPMEPAAKSRVFSPLLI